MQRRAIPIIIAILAVRSERVINMETNTKQIKDLCRLYRSNSKIGLVLGAGISCGSGVPLYEKMTLQVCRALAAQTDGKEIPAISFLAEQLALREELGDETDAQQRVALENKIIQIEPEEIAQLIKTCLSKTEEHALIRQIKDVLYAGKPNFSRKNTPLKHSMVKDSVFRDNPTLDAVITFCAACPDSGVAYYSKQKHNMEKNAKVGGILTTNYDNLVEGAFGTKFGRELLHPVGRVTSDDLKPENIPVYHIHGYVSYVVPDNPSNGIKASEKLVFAEEDYFRTSYDPLGFSSYIAMSFLRRYPCLFIGCSMKDKNMRRFLFQLLQEKKSAPEKDEKRYFAILKSQGTNYDDFIAAVLLSYGVDTIWVKDYCEIARILETVYNAANGVEGNWQKLKEYKRNATDANPAGTGS